MLKETPTVDTGRYDTLRATASGIEEDSHA